MLVFTSSTIACIYGCQLVTFQDLLRAIIRESQGRRRWLTSPERYLVVGSTQTGPSIWKRFSSVPIFCILVGSYQATLTLIVPLVWTDDLQVIHEKEEYRFNVFWEVVDVD